MRDAVLTTDALAIGYTRRQHSPHTVASGIDLALRRGELICILGPNGAGKSTFLRTIAGLQAPLSGHVRLLGQDLHTLTSTERARVMSVVLTERVTGAMFSSYDIVSLGRQPHTDWRGTLTPHDHAVIRRSLDVVRATHLADRLAAELSDGERQRVMVARALAQEPQVLVLDEVTAFLDLPGRVDIMRLLARLAQQTGLSVLVSTHDLDLALRTADQLWLVVGDGRVRAGAPEDLVLDGSIERAFAADGVLFDLAEGAFRVRQSSAVAVTIRGTGIGARWAARAVERAGYRPVPVGGALESPVSVEVHLNEQVQWEVSWPSETLRLDSAGAVVDELRRRGGMPATRA